MKGSSGAMAYGREDWTPAWSSSVAGAHDTDQSSSAAGGSNAHAVVAALCVVARFHLVAADPAALSHQLGLTSSDALTVDDLLWATKELRLKAKRVHIGVARLALTTLPALAPRSNQSNCLSPNGAANWC